jgi:hypothetical protein
MAKLINKKDGTMVVYLTKDFVPVEKEKAELVKIIRPDGTVTFGVPVRG